VCGSVRLHVQKPLSLPLPPNCIAQPLKELACRNGQAVQTYSAQNVRVKELQGTFWLSLVILMLCEHIEIKPKKVSSYELSLIFDIMSHYIKIIILKKQQSRGWQYKER
jgi:hypothetical protein